MSCGGRPLADGHADGVQGQAGQPADDGAVDPDVLQVRAEQQLEAAGGLDRVPPADGPADQGDQLLRRNAPAPPARAASTLRWADGGQVRGRRAAGPRSGRSARSAGCAAPSRAAPAWARSSLLDVAPHRRRERPDLGLAEQLGLDLLAPVAHLLRRLEILGQLQRARRRVVGAAGDPGSAAMSSSTCRVRCSSRSTIRSSSGPGQPPRRVDARGGGAGRPRGRRDTG